MGKYQPALLGGLVIGVLSSLPVVDMGNYCCCLWVIAGGVLTVYLQQQKTPEPLPTSDAMLGGLIAGLVGALIFAVAKSLLVGIMGPIVQESIQQALEQNPEVPPEMRDFILNLATGRGVFALLLAISLPIYAIFGMLGALLGLAFFRKKQPPMVQTS